MSKAMSNAVQVHISIMSQHSASEGFLLHWMVIEFVWKAEELHSFSAAGEQLLSREYPAFASITPHQDTAIVS